MTRRQWLLGGLTAVGAASLGAWFSHRRSSPAPAVAGAADIVFAQTFPDSDGTPRPMSQWRGQILVLNFWATWCPPCVEEMPVLQAARDAYQSKGVEIVGIAIDNAEKVRSFRDKMSLTLPLLVAGAGGTALGKSLGNLSGALPYTVLIDRSGGVAQRKLGQIHAPELRAWLDAQLD
jgi:peroxiredoxin